MPAQRHPVLFARIPATGAVLLPLLLSACGYFQGNEPSPAAVATNTSSDNICEHQWLLESLTVDGREHKSRMFWQKMWRDRPYLTCDKLGFVRGSAGSNPYLGKFNLTNDGGLKWLKPPKISRMTDRRKSSELETDFLRALPRVDRASTLGDTLLLEGSDGTRLEFQQTRELPPATH